MSFNQTTAAKLQAVAKEDDGDDGSEYEVSTSCIKSTPSSLYNMTPQRRWDKDTRTGCTGMACELDLPAELGCPTPQPTMVKEAMAIYHMSSLRSGRLIMLAAGHGLRQQPYLNSGRRCQ